MVGQLRRPTAGNGPVTPIAGTQGGTASQWLRAARSSSAHGFRLALVRAGVRHPVWVRALAGLRSAILCAGLGLGIVLGPVLLGFSVAGLSVLVGGIVVSLLPDLVARAAASSRTRIIAADLPDAIDLITLAMESGLGLEASLQRVALEMGQRSRPLGVEFAALRLALRAGVSRGEALSDMAWRCNARELEMLAALVVQADRLGTPMIDAARAVAQGMREAREFQAEERAGQVSVQLVIPLVLCMLPALFVVLLGPALRQVAVILKDL